MGDCATVLGLSAKSVPSHDSWSPLLVPFGLPPLTPITCLLHLSHPQPTDHAALFGAIGPLPAPLSLAALWAEG